MGHDANEFYPIEVLHEKFGLSATIFKAVDHLGAFYTIEFNRTGKIQGKPAVTRVFRYEHLDALANLVRRSNDRVAELRGAFGGIN